MEEKKLSKKKDKALEKKDKALEKKDQALEKKDQALEKKDLALEKQDLALKQKDQVIINYVLMLHRLGTDMEKIIEETGLAHDEIESIIKQETARTHGHN